MRAYRSGNLGDVKNGHAARRTSWRDDNQVLFGVLAELLARDATEGTRTFGLGESMLDPLAWQILGQASPAMSLGFAFLGRGGVSVGRALDARVS